MRMQWIQSAQRQVWLATLLFCLMLPPEAMASFFDSIGVGARAMAMGSAYGAVSDDLMAIYYNPAGLTQVEGHALLTGYIHCTPSLEEISATDPAFRAERVVSDKLRAPIISLRLDMDRAFKNDPPVHTRVGLLLGSPDNFKAIYRFWDVGAEVPRWIRYGDYWDRVHLMGALSFQVDKFPWISLGIGFRTLISGNNLFLNRTVEPGQVVPGLDINVNSLDLNDLDVAGNADIDVDTRICPTAGIMLFPIDHLRLGYTFRNELSLDIYPVILQGRATQTIIDLGDLALPLYQFIKFNAYFMPQQHNWGVSYLFADKCLVSFDLSFFRWSRFSKIGFDRPDPPFKDIWIPRFGIEYGLSEKIAVRLGYFFEPSPVPDQTSETNFLDNDKHMFSMGGGYTFEAPFDLITKPLVFNLAFQYLHLPTRETVKVPGFTPSSFQTSGDAFTIGGDLTVNF